MAERVRKISSHMGLTMSPTSGAAQNFGVIGETNPNDVVVVSACRTAIGKAKRGSFRNTMPDDLLKAVLEETMKRSGAPMEILGDIVVGNVQLGGAYAGPARTAQFRAGIPYSVPLHSINRQCSSGLQAVATIAASIQAGYQDAGIGAGVESMTQGGGVADPGGKPPPLNIPAVMKNKMAVDALTPMGITSENVAERYGITRTEQDQMAVDSHAKALRAQAEGRFASEIVPVETVVEDKDGNKTPITVAKDDGPRDGSTLERLAKLKTVFKKDGSTTAGNASQVSDGAAAVMLCRRSVAVKHGLPIVGVFRGFKVVGVQPDEMGVGPAAAIPAVCADLNIGVNDVDVYEINEAFASQAVYCVKKLGIPMEKVNPNGGAIALGHPLGCTGARQIATLLAELDRQKKKVGCVSMCIGTGMGAAAIFEKV